MRRKRSAGSALQPDPLWGLWSPCVKVPDWREILDRVFAYYLLWHKVLRVFNTRAVI
jgi:hypothetical protein